MIVSSVFPAHKMYIICAYIYQNMHIWHSIYVICRQPWTWYGDVYLWFSVTRPFNMETYILVFGFYVWWSDTLFLVTPKHIYHTLLAHLLVWNSLIVLRKPSKFLVTDNVQFGLKWTFETLFLSKRGFRTYHIWWELSKTIWTQVLRFTTANC